ncbi:MAG: hypothetical protein ACTHKV_14065 [Flavipsychrobacter sp.]
MKKIAPLAAALLLTFAFTSCKKDYTCTCTVSAGGITSTATPATIHDTKKKAKDACEKDNGTQTINGVAVTKDCKI